MTPLGCRAAMVRRNWQETPRRRGLTEKTRHKRSVWQRLSAQSAVCPRRKRGINEEKRVPCRAGAYRSWTSSPSMKGITPRRLHVPVVSLRTQCVAFPHRRIGIFSHKRMPHGPDIRWGKPPCDEMRRDGSALEGARSHPTFFRVGKGFGRKMPRSVVPAQPPPSRALMTHWAAVRVLSPQTAMGRQAPPLRDSVRCIPTKSRGAFRRHGFLWEQRPQAYLLRASAISASLAVSSAGMRSPNFSQDSLTPAISFFQPSTSTVRSS